jgi:hypothetical protein
MGLLNPVFELSSWKWTCIISGGIGDHQFYLVLFTDDKSLVAMCHAIMETERKGARDMSIHQLVLLLNYFFLIGCFQNRDQPFK